MIATITRFHADVSGTNNPMYGKKRPDFARIASERMKRLLRDEPDKHPMRILARHGAISRGHKILAVLIQKSYGTKPEINWPVKTEKTTRFIDVALPAIRLGFEYDEPYWHDPEEDSKRDIELAHAGWTIRRAGPSLMRSYAFLEKEYVGGCVMPNRSPMARRDLDPNELKILAESGMAFSEIARIKGTAIDTVKKHLAKSGAYVQGGNAAQRKRQQAASLAGRIARFRALREDRKAQEIR